MNPKNVRAEFARAQKSLQAAKLLHADGLFEDAVSRAYYAVMHSAKAAWYTIRFQRATPRSDASSVRSWCEVVGSRNNGLPYWRENRIDALPPTMMRHFQSTLMLHCRLLKMLTALSNGCGDIWWRREF